MKEISAFQKEVIALLNLGDEEISPVSSDQEQGLYAMAFEIYQKKDYRGAAKLFTQLILTNPFSPDYWRGLASAKQMAREYIASLHAWGLTALLNEADPFSHFHAAECYFKVGETEEGLKALDAALDLSSEHPELVEKIEALKAAQHAHC